MLMVVAVAQLSSKQQIKSSFDVCIEMNHLLSILD